MSDDRRLTAYHEAGHLVASFRLFPDRVRGHVTIVPDERLEAAGHLFQEVDMTSTSIEAEVLVYYAGAAAELRLDPSRARWIREGGRVDDAVGQELLGRRWLELEPKVWRRATEFVAEHWGEIQAVAKELLRRKTLTGREAELVCEAATGGQLAVDARRSLKRYRALRKAARPRRWFFLGPWRPGRN